MMRRLLPAAFALAIAACGSGARSGDTALVDSISTTLGAEKDSLLSEVLETTKLVNDLNTELAKASTVGVSPVVAGEHTMTTKAEERAVLLGKVREVVARLTEAESSLARSKERINSMSVKDRKLLAQVEEYGKAIADLKTSMAEQEETFQAIIEGQRTEIVSLGGQLDTVRASNTQLGQEKTALKDTVSELTRYKNTVYVVSGTKDELLNKGVIVNEGHKFLFFGSKTLVPARNLTPEEFTVLNKTQDSVIPLPHSEKQYRILSRQSLEYVSQGATADGKIAGELHIASPEQFWAPSKFLILVED